MDCNEFRSRVSAILDGEVDASESSATRLHMEECTDCSGLFSDLKSLLNRLRKLPLLKTGPGFSEALMTRISGEGSGFTSRLRRI